MTIAKKTRLLPPPFVGTRVTIETPADESDFGIFGLTQADKTQPIEIDWGDGTSERFTSSVSKKTHRYARRGTYEIRIGDNIRSLNISVVAADGRTVWSEVYAPMIRSCIVTGQHSEWIGGYCFTNAKNMTRFEATNTSLFRIGVAGFKGCESLSGELRLPTINTIPDTEENQIFGECPNLTRIRFAEKYKDVLTAMESYKADPRLGAANATVSFDL